MSYEQSGITVSPDSVTVVRTATVAFLAGTAFGTVLAATGRLSAVTALYGLDSVVGDWLLVYVHSLAACAIFLAVLPRVARFRYAPLPVRESIRHPFPGACVGLAYGVVLWLTVVGYGVPLWFELVGGGSRPVPYSHAPSLLALLAFGAVAGATYPLCRAYVNERK